MKILGIETSCDETAASIVEDGRIVHSNIVASSLEMHKKTGGIIPEQAARQQIRSITPVIQEALEQGLEYKNLHTPPSIDAIAVTYGPGLIGSLLVGVEAAKTLSYVWKKPIVPVNHLVGHIYANWLEDRVNDNKSGVPEFPAIALVVSGGHTDLVLMKDHGKIKWIGGTRDDAAGEAFDKTARLLGLLYPGGPSISKEAEKYFSEQSKVKVKKLNLFPRPLINEDTFDFSFSGLKTAVINKYKKNSNIIPIPMFAAEVQEAIVDVLVNKSIKAIENYRPRSFILAGGVAANKRLREKLQLRITNETLQVVFHVPKISLCTDNAAYIAACANFNYQPIPWRNVVAKPDLTIVGET